MRGSAFTFDAAQLEGLAHVAAVFLPVWNLDTIRPIPYSREKVAPIQSPSSCHAMQPGYTLLVLHFGSHDLKNGGVKRISIYPPSYAWQELPGKVDGYHPSSGITSRTLEWNTPHHTPKQEVGRPSPTTTICKAN